MVSRVESNKYLASDLLENTPTALLNSFLLHFHSIVSLRVPTMHARSQCLVLLGKLKALCEQKTKIFHDRMSKCREILTPRQVVKLILWIDDHSEVLEKVCPGWGSEHLRSKS